MQRHHFVEKGPHSQSYGFSSHAQMWELTHKESWAPKNQCFRTVVLQKTLESPLDCKEIKSVNPKEFGRTDAEVEAPILRPPNAKNWFTGKDPDAGKDWRQEEKGAAEDEMVGWHHWFNGHEFEQTRGDSEGQASLAWLQFMGWQRVGHNLATERQQPVYLIVTYYKVITTQIIQHLHHVK